MCGTKPLQCSRSTHQEFSCPAQRPHTLIFLLGWKWLIPPQDQPGMKATFFWKNFAVSQNPICKWVVFKIEKISQSHIGAKQNTFSQTGISITQFLISQNRRYFVFFAILFDFVFTYFTFNYVEVKSRGFQCFPFMIFSCTKIELIAKYSLNLQCRTARFYKNQMIRDGSTQCHYSKTQF